MEQSYDPATTGGAFLLASQERCPVFIPEEFTSEELLIGKTASDFLRKEVLPCTERIEQGDHALMHSLMRKAGELGLLAADIPEIYGGQGLRITTSALLAEKLNWQQSFALTHEAHTVIGTLPLLFFGNDDQKRRYLPRLASGEWICSFALSEANSGSDALAAQTRAVLSPEGTHYLLNGVKMWITNSAFAQLFTVFGKVDNDRFTAFLVERDFPGVSFGKEEHKLGMHGTSTRRVILESVPVPVENALEPGKGHYAAFCALNMGRFKLEAGAVGGLKETLAACVAYARQRKTFGREIASYGLIQHKLAEMAARTFCLESMVYRLAGDLDRAFAGIEASAPDASIHYHRAAEEFAIECNIVKVIGSEAYSALTDEAIQIHGGYGYTEEFPVARAWRDQRLLRIGEGANEIVRVAIVNLLMRREKLGRLPLSDAGRSAFETPPDIGAGPASDPQADLNARAEAARRLALALLYFGTTQLGGDLLEMQEVTAAIADAVIAAYALESMALRTAKLRESSHPRYKAALQLAQVAALGCSESALQAARYAADALMEPETPDVRSGALSRPFDALCTPLDRPPGNPMRLRRSLATRVLERDGYPLA